MIQLQAFSVKGLGWVPAMALPDEVAAKIEALEASTETKKALGLELLGLLSGTPGPSPRSSD